MSQRYLILQIPKIGLFCSAILALLCSVPSFAQQAVDLTGTVTDISGAVIPGASVVARSSVTGDRKSVV